MDEYHEAQMINRRADSAKKGCFEISRYPNKTDEVNDIEHSVLSLKLLQTSV